MTAIRTRELTRRFGDLVAVDGLDLAVEEGEIYGFLGPNGAGKSTTINVLLGFLNPTSGEAAVLGMDATRESRAIRARIGLLPEGFDVYPNLTGRELVASAIQTKRAEDDPDAVLDRVGLEPDARDRRAGGYSKGMKQRLGLGIALVGEPDLLVLDEPSSGLDPSGVKLLRTIVREEADRGATVFFSSHVLDQVERVCDRVGIMAHGELVAEDTIEHLRSDLGAESVVTAALDAVPDLAPVEALAGVRSVHAEGDTVEITTTTPTAKMPALRRLDDAATVEDVTIEDASLEALFERYTNDGTGAPPDDGDSPAAADAAPAGEATPVALGGDDA